jgi:hypothetical protein
MDCLVVDPDVNVRRATVGVERITRSGCFEVTWHEASSKAEAMELIKCHRPRVVIIEAALHSVENFGNLDGVAVAYAARRCTEHVVLWSTDRLDEVLRFEMIENGIHVEMKPLSVAALVGAMVRRALASPEPRYRPTEGVVAYAANAVAQIEAPLPEITNLIELRVAMDRIAACAGNKTRAAEQLQVSRRWLDRRVERFESGEFKLDLPERRRA